MAGVPLQPSCDPNDPEEHALWALVGMAGPTSVSYTHLTLPTKRIV